MMRTEGRLSLEDIVAVTLSAIFVVFSLKLVALPLRTDRLLSGPHLIHAQRLQTGRNFQVTNERGGQVQDVTRFRHPVPPPLIDDQSRHDSAAIAPRLPGQKIQPGIRLKLPAPDPDLPS